ncbi:MAG: hypothetical protein GTN93_21375, partial [Anaerolineae bacterium]|nr:hypothetical protein [Anaerolineae bacterium]
MSKHGVDQSFLAAQPGELEGITISEWIASRLWVDYGTPFSFEGRPYLKKIHDLSEQKILFRTGRQVEKTSSLAAKLVSWSCLRNNWKSLYVSPSQNQTRVFSHARVDRVLNSPYVRARYFDPADCIDFVYEKQFKNGSAVLMNYASTEADRCVSIYSNLLRPNGSTISMWDVVHRKAVGLELVTWDENRKKLSTGTISQIHINGIRRVGGLVVEGRDDVLVCTGDHRVWTKAGRWAHAEKVAASRTDDMDFRTVACVEDGQLVWRRVIEFRDAGSIDVIDLTMSNDHSFVADGVVVHNCRGISADMLLADEVQDMTHDVFPVLEEVLSHAPEPYKIYAGTPKTLNNAME